MIKDLSKLSFLYCYTDEVSDYHEDALKVAQHWRSVIALSVEVGSRRGSREENRIDQEKYEEDGVQKMGRSMFSRV